MSCRSITGSSQTNVLRGVHHAQKYQGVTPPTAEPSIANNRPSLGLSCHCFFEAMGRSRQVGQLFAEFLGQDSAPSTQGTRGRDAQFALSPGEGSNVTQRGRAGGDYQYTKTVEDRNKIHLGMQARPQNFVKQFGGRGHDVQRIVANTLGQTNMFQKGGKGSDLQITRSILGGSKSIQHGGRGNDHQVVRNKVSGTSVQRGAQGADKLRMHGGIGNDNARQYGGQGSDSLVANGNRGDDRIEQRGRRGADQIVAKGGQGDDTLIAGGGRGTDSVQLHGGLGDDRLVYSASRGKDRARLSGGKGQDTAIIRTHGKNVTVIGGKGKVLFGDGSGNVVHINGMEKVRIKGKDGKILFQRGYSQTKAQPPTDRPTLTTPPTTHQEPTRVPTLVRDQDDGHLEEKRADEVEMREFGRVI